MNTKVDLTASYAGLKLRNPIIISSSGVTENIDKIKILEQAGAGSVVLKSLFEEQIMMYVQEDMANNDNDYPEAHDILKTFLTAANLTKYTDLIQ